MKISKLISSIMGYSIGTDVLVMGRISGHNYQIGGKYKIFQIYPNGQFVLVDGNGIVGNYISDIDLSLTNVPIKEILEEKILDLLEFLKDYESEVDLNRIDNDWKAYIILKSIKKYDNDFDRMRAISENLD
jgi:hypothetical protein